jgi:hypothetical protein
MYHLAELRHQGTSYALKLTNSLVGVLIDCRNLPLVTILSQFGPPPFLTNRCLKLFFYANLTKHRFFEVAVYPQKLCMHYLNPHISHMLSQL